MCVYMDQSYEIVYQSGNDVFGKVDYEEIQSEGYHNYETNFVENYKSNDFNESSGIVMTVDQLYDLERMKADLYNML